MPLHRTGRFKLAQGWIRGEDWWGDPVTMNFKVQDALLHPHVISMTQPQPPLLNAEGDCYIVPIGGTGAFSGMDGKFAYLDAAGWIFITPVRGVRIRCDNPDNWFWYAGDADGWKPENWVPNGPPLLGTRYDLVIWVGFEALPGDQIGGMVMPEAMTLPLNAVGSSARAIDWPGAVVTMAIRRNNAPIGTITFTPGSLTGSIDVAADQPFGAGDLISVVLPGDMPDGFENYAITLRLLLAAQGG